MEIKSDLLGFTMFFLKILLELFYAFKIKTNTFLFVFVMSLVPNIFRVLLCPDRLAIFAFQIY